MNGDIDGSLKAVEVDNRDIIWWILFRNGCDVVERQFISKGW